MERFFYPIVFLIGATAMLVGGSIEAAFFHSPAQTVPAQPELLQHGIAELFSRYDTWLLLATILTGIATWRAVSQARDTSRRQLRAYLALKPTVLLTDFHSTPALLSVRLAVINEGPTPAELQRIRYSLTLVHAQANEALTGYFDKLDRELDLHMTQFSKADQHIDLGAIEVSSSTLTSLMAGQLHVQVKGKTEYLDIFGNGHTAFVNCRMPGPSVGRFLNPQLPGYNPTQYEWTFGSKHNFTD